MKTVFDRGYNYAKQAALIWRDREYRLLGVWSLLNEEPVTLEVESKRRRVGIVIGEIKKRRDDLWKAHFEFKRRQEKNKRDSDHAPITLECENFECKYSPSGCIQIVYKKNFVPDKIKCKVCGKPLKAQGEIDIERQLLDLGIEFE